DLDERPLRREARARTGELFLGARLVRELGVDVAVDEEGGPADHRQRQDADDDDRRDEDRDPGPAAAGAFPCFAHLMSRFASSATRASPSLSHNLTAARNSSFARPRSPALSASLPSS